MSTDSSDFEAAAAAAAAAASAAGTGVEPETGPETETELETQRVIRSPLRFAIEARKIIVLEAKVPVFDHLLKNGRGDIF